MISMQEHNFVPLYFKDILDPKTHKMKVRMVNTRSEWYQIAYRYMIRLKPEDFSDPHELAKYAATANISLEEFREQFGYLVDEESHSKGDAQESKTKEKSDGNSSKSKKNDSKVS